ncbi:MAG: LPS export ABC transporter periplasmic protein LptC [Thermoanaerobaculia bacterium]|nr:LPS export ABC transporter periplasmic protein LptC [Thermoanaerobaculia bacterium]
MSSTVTPSQRPPTEPPTAPGGTPSQQARIRRSGGEDFRRPTTRPAAVEAGAPPTQRAQRPYRRLRRILLLLGVGGILIVLLLIFAYNFGKEDVDSADSSASVTTEGAVSLAEKVRYSHSSGGVKVFEVWADNQRLDDQGVSHLEGVRVEFFRQDGASYVVTSRRATLDERTLAALFEGDVEVRGWRSLELDARAIEISRGGRVITSRGAVDIRWLDESGGPFLEGRASEMRVDREQDVIALSGGVHLRTVAGVYPALRLDAQRLNYSRADALIRALDDVRLMRGGQQLACKALTLFLQEDQRTLKMARARFEVVGSMVSLGEDGGRTRVNFRGELLEMRPAETDPGLSFIDLTRGDGPPVELDIVGPDGVAQTMVADTVSARTQDDRLNQLEARAETGGSVSLTEYLDLSEPFILRRVCADRLVAGFDSQGGLGQLFLESQVEMRDQRRQVTGGDQATYNAIGERLEITGPGVEIYDEKGDFYAPKIVVMGEKGILEATGGVEATLRDTARSALSGTPLGQGQGPIRVQSQTATLTERPPVFVFDGDVRAWQGDNLVLASQLRGDQVKSEMAASGGVTTLWTPRGGSVKRPVEVKAGTMTFDDEAGILTYSGGVQLTSDQRKLSCREMMVELGPGGQGAERMICEQDVVLIDPVGGKRVEGDRAEFLIAADRIEVQGDPVELENADGSRLEGRFLRYDVESGATRLSTTLPGEPPEGSIRVPLSQDDTSGAEADGASGSRDSEKDGGGRG